MSSNPNPHEVGPMVATYKKIFLYLSIITVIGIVIAFMHPPVWLIVTIGLIFIISKSVVVFESLKNLLVGRNIIIIVFLMTVIFVAGLVLTGVLEYHSHIVGTQDISRQLMMEQQEEGHHGD
jgi:hypothetical protein